MARLFGFIGNRPELGPRVLLAYAEYLKAQGDPLGWGLGFYQFGEVLLRRRPLEERKEIELAKMTESLRTEVLIGHARNPTVGNLRTENTHPFRYRQWLFAQTGTLHGFSGLRDRLSEMQPDFLRPNVRGDTDSEAIFYLFLSYLHDQGHLDDSSLAAEHVHTALRSTMARVDALCDDVAVPHHTGDILVTNGDYVIAVHRSGKMGYRLVNDARQVGYYLEGHEGDSRGSNAEIGNLEQIQCCVIASPLDELPPDWLQVPNQSLMSCSRKQAPLIEPLFA